VTFVSGRITVSAPMACLGCMAIDTTFVYRASEAEGKMRRSDLLALINREYPGLRAEEVESVVDLFFGEIAAHLNQGRRVELRGFGSFRTVQREARIGKSPFTGEAFSIPAKRVPRFRASRCLRLQIAKLPVSASACASRSGGSAG